jgi:predicted O-methyltransferase YrrM
MEIQLSGVFALRDITRGFWDARNIPSDIFDHIDTIYAFAKGKKHITEFGFRQGISTWGLLAARPERLVCYDILPVDTLEHSYAAETEKISFTFWRADVLECPIERTDLIMIDTWHSYAQLSAELAMHAPHVNPDGYIIMHDTETYGMVDEPRYPHASDKAIQQPNKTGLKQAIADFLQNERKTWSISLQVPHCNGLTILKKASVVQ